MNRNIFRKISEWRYSFTQGIKNIIYWFSIIWKDRDWDYAYINRLLYWKLKRMYNRFSDPNATCVDWTYSSSAKALQALRICIAILEREQSNFTVNLDCPIRHIMSIEERDHKVFHSLMEQYSTYWWD